MRYVITTAEDLELLRTRALPDQARVTLAGPFADDRLERVVNRCYGACGCEEGSVAVLTAVGVCVAGAVRSGLDGPFTWWRIALYLAGAALAGKALGLAVARLRLRRAIRTLQGRLERPLARPRRESNPHLERF